MFLNTTANSEMNKIEDFNSTDDDKDNEDAYLSNQNKTTKRRVKLIKKCPNKYQIHLFDESISRIEEVYEFEVQKFQSFCID